MNIRLAFYSVIPEFSPMRWSIFCAKKCKYIIVKNIVESSLSVLPYCQFEEYFQHTSADEFEFVLSNLSFYQGFS